MNDEPVCPGELAHQLLGDLARGHRSSDSPDQKRALAELAALVEIGDQLGRIERTLRGQSDPA